MSKAGEDRGARHVKGLGPLAVVVAHDPCTRNPSRGSMQEGKESAREGRHLLRIMVVTDDVSQLPMSSLNELALPVYPYRK